MLISYHNAIHTNLLASIWGLLLISFAAISLKVGSEYCLAHCKPEVEERIICMCNPPSLTIVKDYIPPIRPITPKTIFIKDRMRGFFAPPVILPTDDIRNLSKKTKKSKFYLPKFTAIPLITPCTAHDSIPSDSLFRTLKPNEKPSIEPSDTTLVRGN
jgi:hypothetical protein